MTFCPSCGKKLFGGEKYCPSCGKKIVAGALGEVSLDKILFAICLALAIALVLVLFNPLTYIASPIYDYIKSEVLSTSKNCGSDIECFKKLASVCSKAFVYYDYSFAAENASVYLETLGFEGSECLVYLKILRAPVVFSKTDGLDMQCRINAINTSLQSTNCFGPLADYFNEYSEYSDLWSLFLPS